MQPDLIMALVGIGAVLFGSLAWAMLQIMHRFWPESDTSPDRRLTRPPTPSGALPIGSVAAALNLVVDPQPHALIIGPTGSGKTTFTRALLANRPGRIAVLTPKPDPNDWPGVPIVTIGDDGRFADLTRAFVQLDSEIRSRLVAVKRGQPSGEMLTIVCDDWPVLASECGRPASDLFKLVGRLGRSLGVRLIVLSQSERVKSLGLDGEGDAKDNFIKIVLKPDHSATIDRISIGHATGVDKVIDTSEALSLASQGHNPARWWQLAIVLPKIDPVEFLPPVPQPTRIESVEQVDANRILRDALGIDGRNGETSISEGVSGVAVSQMESEVLVSNRDETNVSRPELTQMLPPDVLKRISSIDWYTVALAVEGGIAETMMLKSLGYPPGSTAKYQVARERLQAARAALREVSAKG
jgi:energy-coupling factor transporter ATP-binding protein EcfA2